MKKNLLVFILMLFFVSLFAEEELIDLFWWANSFSLWKNGTI